MDVRLRRLERRIAAGNANPDDEERLIRLTCRACGHAWTEKWDNTPKNINKGALEYKGFYFHCARCDPNAERRITDVAEIGSNI